MGVIKRRIDLSMRRAAVVRLREEFPEDLDCRTVGQLCTKVVTLAGKELGGHYTVMGGFSGVEQLLCKAQELLNDLEESGKLAEMYDSFLDNCEPESIDTPPESEMEDAYHLTDSLKLAGSEKQQNWAKSIAVKNSHIIAGLRLPYDRLPKNASWWIENRNNIEEGLREINA